MSKHEEEPNCSAYGDHSSKQARLAEAQLYGYQANKHFEFSKLILLIQTAVVAYISWRVLGFVELAIESGFTGSLPYLTTFISVVWAAYGTIVDFYMNKSKGENVEKIKGSNTRLSAATELDDPEDTPDIVEEEKR